MKKLAGVNYDYSCDKDELPLPFKLTDKDIKKVTIAGHEFVDLGWCLACPKCGRVSAVSMREDVDKKIDFFLKFGCEHYEKKK